MKKIFIFIVLLLIIGGGGLYYWFGNGMSPADPTDKSKKTIVVREGDGIRKIAENLKNAGIIRDPIVFFLLIKQTGVENKLQAGVFYLSPSMTPEKILQELQTGKFDLAITIPEGKRAEEIADIFEQNFSNYSGEWRDKLIANEGFLFPDTYYFPKDTEIEKIITIMKNNFDTKYSEVVNKTSLSQKEVVILASLIEREAKHEEDRRLVSSVIHNRLNEGMKLDIDATAQYALGYNQAEKRWWKQGLTYDDLEIDSLYNTYTNPGLPPEPICNPGIAAIAAAGDPAESDYIYYISDKQGINRYARDFAEHRQNIEKYR